MGTFMCRRFVVCCFLISVIAIMWNLTVLVLMQYCCLVMRRHIPVKNTSILKRKKQIRSDKEYPRYEKK